MRPCTCRRDPVLMEPSDWIALAALGVSALALIVGPVIGAHLERRARTETARRETYVRVLALLRQRADDLENRALGWLGPAEPTENDEVQALLFLYASPKVWGTVEDFFKLYYQAAAPALTSDLARGRGEDDVGARLRIGELGDRLTQLVDQARDAMRKDVGVDRIPGQRVRR